MSPLTFYLSLRSSKKSKLNPLKNIDWQQVYSSSNLRSLYTVEVKNRFDLLSRPDIEKKYQTLIEANEHVCLSILPKKTKVKKKQIFQDDLVTIARQNLLEAKTKHQARVTRKTTKNLANAQKALDEAYLNAESLFKGKSIP